LLATFEITLLELFIVVVFALSQAELYSNPLAVPTSCPFRKWILYWIPQDQNPVTLPSRPGKGLLHVESPEICRIKDLCNRFQGRARQICILVALQRLFAID
jgi:hypothetical protein